MSEQIIPESDTNERKTARAGDKSTPETTAAASIPLFDPAGAITTTPPTPNAPLPDAPEAPVKRGRGRPAGTGKTKAKTPAKPNAKAEVPPHLMTAALYVVALDKLCGAVSGGEYKIEGEAKDETLQAAIAYFEQSDYTLPPWAGLAIVSGANIAAAFQTPQGKSKAASMWEKAKAAWTLWRAK